MGWKRFKEMEKNGILGWWEHEENTSMITLTKGHAHIVHKGMAATVLTPEERFLKQSEHHRKVGGETVRTYRCGY